MQECAERGKSEHAAGSRIRNDGRNGGEGEDAPISAGGERKRKENAELRLVAHQSERKARERGAPLDIAEAGRHQRGGQEPVLSRRERGKYPGCRQRQERAALPAGEFADSRTVKRERCRAPQHESRRIGQARQRAHDEEKERRIGEAERAGKIMSDRAHFGGVLQPRIVGRKRMSAHQGQMTRRPERDEVVDHGPPAASRIQIWE